MSVPLDVLGYEFVDGSGSICIFENGTRVIYKKRMIAWINNGIPINPYQKDMMRILLKTIDDYECKQVKHKSKFSFSNADEGVFWHNHLFAYYWEYYDEMVIVYMLEKTSSLIGEPYHKETPIAELHIPKYKRFLLFLLDRWMEYFNQVQSHPEDLLWAASSLKPFED